MRSLALGSMLLANLVVAQDVTYPDLQPVELGRIAWHRDFAEATGIAKQSGKPLFTLFQEVPG